jgi:hypothetical protein
MNVFGGLWQTGNHYLHFGPFQILNGQYGLFQILDVIPFS